MRSLYRKAAIVGVAESDYGIVPDKTALHLAAQASARALADAGIRKAEIDAVFSAGLGYMDAVILSDYLGLKPRHAGSTNLGGCSFNAYVGQAAAAVAAGLCDVALIAYGSTQRSQGRATGTGWAEAFAPADHFELPYGTLIAARYALVTQRHMYEHGTTSAQLAEIAVACRKHAALNPLALYRDPITVDDVLKSRMICSPLHLLDCCVVTDGGGAVILTTPERARDARKGPVWVLGAGEGVSHYVMPAMHPMTVSPGAISGPPAFQMAGVTPADIDTAQLYDSFTITVLLALEDLGFCKKGEGGSFVEGGRIALGGQLPINTDGGGLSSSHPGMRGIFTVIEAVRQLRGECGPRQVPNACLALAHGVGGSMFAAATVILGKD